LIDPAHPDGEKADSAVVIICPKCRAMFGNLTGEKGT
jgi:hypothetical protein